jgi:hypothetical protein
MFRPIPVLVVLALLGGACGGSSPTAPTPAPPPPTPPARFELAGEWVRINSSFAELDGMIVRVSGDGSQALIVSTPANPFRFQPDDLKWRAITRVSATRLQFEDLVRQSGSGAMSYVSGFIEAQPNAVELSMTFPTTGTVQQWRRR